jgi:alpha-amylase
MSRVLNLSYSFIHNLLLFQWSWADVASECETFLSKKGFKAVQVSPPQEHITGSTWWTRYQPVTYTLQSRSGNESQFIDMVKRCNNVGVGIVVDAVINHMAAGSGVGKQDWALNFIHSKLSVSCFAIFSFD